MPLLTSPPLDRWTLRPSGLLVPNTRSEPAPQRKPIAVDFFAGAGGFSLGFKEAGWHVAAAVEWDMTAACTYLCNLGGPDTVVHVNEPERIKNWDKLQGDEQRRWVKAGAPEGFGGAGTGWIATSDHRNCHAISAHGEITGPNKCVSCHWGPERCGCAVCVEAEPCEHFWLADVRKLSGAEILDALGMKPGEVGAVIGGPPCQGFSMSGKRDVMDPRNSLVFEYARLILEINPKTFVMENVPGILNMVTPEGPPVLDMFCRILSDGGYSTYEALKRAMTGVSGGRAGVRGQPKQATARDGYDDGDEHSGQLDIFDGVTS
jgi:DNA (cytosine-5)-methyltransferase 1